MGFAGIARVALIAAIGATGASCGMLSDPATPCRAMDLGHAREGTVVTPRRAPVVAVTSEQPFMLREVCEREACHIERDRLTELDPGSPVLVTSTGRYAVGIDHDGTVHSYEILETRDEDGHFVRRIGSTVAPATNGDSHARHLVAGLRDSDYVITRTVRGSLGVYIPGRTTMEIVADDIPNLRVAAVGEQYLVGWQPLGEGRDALYLVPVHPDATGRPIKLAEATAFSRVVLTSGDERVVATSGTGSSALTLVFSVPDGAPVDSFAGALISGRGPGEELPGLRAASPDGSHVVYRRPTGSLAMRNLDVRASCMVRSGHAGDHQVAGFAPNGLLFMEAAQKVGASHVLTLDPITGTLTALGEPGGNYHLSAVAARMPGQPADGVDDGREAMAHWAVVVEDGHYHAISTDGPSTSLGLHDVTFMARDDGAVWLLDTERHRSERQLTVRRIAPRPGAKALRFDPAEETGPTFVDADTGTQHSAFVTELPISREICAATGIPGAWGYQCSDTIRGGKYFSAGPATGTEDVHDRTQTPEYDEPLPADD